MARPPMRCACIDIGSNTTRLLVADHHAGRLRVVHEQRAFTRIGRELVGADTISPAKRTEVIAVVAAQRAVAQRCAAADVRGVATAAIRRAANGVELVEEIRARTGVDVRILSDREEARLAFVGAAGMLEAPDPVPLGVIDVGGGSSEVVVGEPPDRVIWWASLPVGSGTLAARWVACDPPTAAELTGARGAVRAAVARLGEIGAIPARTLAVGGSATSLCRLAGDRLDEAALADALERLTAAPAAIVAQRYGIDAERVRLLPAGLLIMEALTRRLGGVISVGRGGIREGVLLEAGAR